jgi:hypothetical protein
MIAEGSIIGSGSLSLHTGKYKQEYLGSTVYDENFLDLSLMTWGGYFIKDNLGIGAGIDVTSLGFGSGDNTDSETHIFFGPAIRYYFAEGPFIQGFYGFGSGTDKNGSTTTKYNASKWYGVVGYSVRISDTVLFDPMVGYQSITFKEKDFDDKYMNSGLFIQMGFTILFVNK